MPSKCRLLKESKKTNFQLIKLQRSAIYDEDPFIGIVRKGNQFIILIEDFNIAIHCTQIHGNGKD